jgi:carboxypeptidase family protein
MLSMLKLKLWVTIFGLAATVQSQTISTEPPQPSFQLSGTTVNAVTGQPLGQIEVAIGPAETSGLQKTITDAQGRFAFSGLAKGKYWLAAHGRGFPTQRYNEHEEFSSAIVVGRADLPSEGIRFRLRPGASISGIVTDDFNEGVRGAQVMLFRSAIAGGKSITAAGPSLSSDDQGRYRVSHLPAGTYYVAVSARPWYAQRRPSFDFTFDEPHLGSVNIDNDTAKIAAARLEKQKGENERGLWPLDVAYPITFFASTTDSNSATPIVLKSGDQAVADVTLTAVPAVHVRVQQADPTSEATGTLSQRLFGNFSLPIDGQVVRTPKGELEISGVAPGQFTLTSQTSGANPATSTQEVNLDRDGEISAPKRSSAIAVRGVVTVDGKPVSRGAYVQLRSEDPYGAPAGAVLDKGEFQISDPVKPGVYRIVVFNAGGGAIVSSVARDQLPAAEGNRVEINGSGPVQLDIKLSSGVGRVEGVAVKDGKAFPGAMIVLVPEDFEHHLSFVRRDQSDGDGTFVLPRAAPGKYKVVAMQNGWDIEWSNPAVLRPYLKKAESIEVMTNQKYFVKVTVQ